MAATMSVNFTRFAYLPRSSSAVGVPEELRLLLQAKGVLEDHRGKVEFRAVSVRGDVVVGVLSSSLFGGR